MFFRFRFSLRTVFFVVTLLSVGLAWHMSRASWYRTRLELKAELEAMGYSFHTVQDVKYKEVFADHTAERSWLGQWDVFWFGDEATKSYALCGVDILGFRRMTLPVPDRSLGKVFPEIEAVVIVNSFDRQSLLINGATIPRLKSTNLKLWQEMQKEFAELPNLRVFFCTIWGIDNCFVEALPQNNQLEIIVNTPIVLNPDQAIALLDKSPKLGWFHLNESAIDAGVQKALSALFTEEKVDHPHHAAERPNEPHVNLYTNDSVNWLE